MSCATLALGAPNVTDDGCSSAPYEPSWKRKLYSGHGARPNTATALRVSCSTAEVKAAVSNGVAFGSGQYEMRCGTPPIVKSHWRSSPASTGDSTSMWTVGAKNVSASAVDLSAVAMRQDFGISRCTYAGASSFPTTY